MTQPPRPSTNPDHHRAAWSPAYEDRICYECSLFSDCDHGRPDVVALWPCAVAHEDRMRRRARRSRRAPKILAPCL